MGNCLAHADVLDYQNTSAMQAGAHRKSGEHEGEDAAAAVLGDHLSTPVQISISCQRLRDRDTFSKSDPMAVLYVGTPSGWTELGRTEFISNTCDPKFVTKIRMQFMFEEIQQLKVMLFDVDTRSSNVYQLDLSKQDFLGQAVTQLSDLVTRPGGVELPLQPRGDFHSEAAGRRRNLGSATLAAVEVSNVRAEVRLQLSARELADTDFWSKSDPFVRISAIRGEGGLLDPVYKTEVVMNNLNPRWKELRTTLRALCNGDMHQPLLLEVMDYDADGSHDLIGAAQTSLHELQERLQHGLVELPLTVPSGRGSRRRPSTKLRGVLVVHSMRITPRPSFLDYVRGGCLLNFMVAIDFTASNGDPRDPRSLHYVPPNFSFQGNSHLQPQQPQYSAQYSGAAGFVGPQLNQYQAAMVGVSEVLAHYSHDQRFQMYGFGAQLSPGAPASHCFTLTGDPSDANVAGIEGMHLAYASAIANPTLKLGGPTRFAPIVREAATLASRLPVSQSHQSYLCLLILTDGSIMDMESTKREIIQACDLPLSILIVGVGEADFKSMHELDGDGDYAEHEEPGIRAAAAHRRRRPPGSTNRLTVGSLVASRDIVQFVSFREFASVLQLPPGSAAGQALAKALLAELPEQLLSFMKRRGLQPMMMSPASESARPVSSGAAPAQHSPAMNYPAPSTLAAHQGHPTASPDTTAHDHFNAAPVVIV